MGIEQESFFFQYSVEVLHAFRVRYFSIAQMTTADVVIVIPRLTDRICVVLFVGYTISTFLSEGGARHTNIFTRVLAGVMGFRRRSQRYQRFRNVALLLFGYISDRAIIIVSPRWFRTPIPLRRIKSRSFSNIVGTVIHFLSKRMVGCSD